MPSNVVVLIGGIILYRLLELIITSAYKRFTGNNYVTRGYCSSCQKGEAALAEEIRVIRQVLLVVAVQLGVPESEWRKLVK